METIKVNITEEQIQVSVEKCIVEALKSTYNNPVSDAVTKALKEKEGQIAIYVNDIIQSAISNPEFKTRLGEIVLSKMIELALNKR